MNFREIIKELRIEAGYSQTKLAELLHISRSTESDWETGRSEASIEDLINIAKLFNKPIDFIVGVADEWGNVQLSSGSVSGNNNVVNSHNQIHTSAAQLPADEAELLRLWKKAPAEKRRAIIELLK